jgi:hypothetical protein
LQQRHGPATNQSAAGGIHPTSLFFDSEAMQVHKESQRDSMEQMLELLTELNRRQTTIAPSAGENTTRTSVAGVEVERPEPRFSLVPQGLESATHARYATSSGLHHVTAAGQALFEQIGILFSVPRGLTTGQGSAVSGAGPQNELFQSSLATLRSHVETALTAVYAEMFNAPDQRVKLVSFNPECKDIPSILSLHAAGLLDTGVASRLAADALGIDACPSMAGGVGEADDDASSQVSNSRTLQLA